MLKTKHTQHVLDISKNTNGIFNNFFVDQMKNNYDQNILKYGLTNTYLLYIKSIHPDWGNPARPKTK